MAAAKSATQMLVYAVTLRRGEHPAKVSQRWIRWRGILVRVRGGRAGNEIDGVGCKLQSSTQGVVSLRWPKHLDSVASYLLVPRRARGS